MWILLCSFGHTCTYLAYPYAAIPKVADRIGSVDSGIESPSKFKKNKNG